MLVEKKVESYAVYVCVCRRFASVRFGLMEVDLDGDGWGRMEGRLHDCAEDAGPACKMGC